MGEETLFELPAIEERPGRAPTAPGEARVVVRCGISLSGQQWTWNRCWLKAVLSGAAFYGPIRAVVERPGRPTTDPQVLLALWLLATVDGIGSARRLSRLCQEHDAYRWMRGHVPINYHMLSDFRVAHQEALDDLLSQTIGSLMAAGAVRLERVAQDGMRVRSSAGAAWRAGTETCLEEARAQVDRLAKEREHPDPGVTRRERAARERGARERRPMRRWHAPGTGQEGAPTAHQSTAQRSKVTTGLHHRPPGEGDEDAASGRPNVELATDSANGVIVGVSVTSEGTDAGQAAPTMRTGRALRPERRSLPSGCDVRAGLGTSPSERYRRRRSGAVAATDPMRRHSTGGLWT